jgi:potassium-transporting ATPase KdpC subunit
MNAHLRANLWLLGSTVVICCALYPLTLWAVGRRVFPDKAAGSLVLQDGRTVGSRLIAQPFSGKEYFWPRPSSPSYDASASAGSNLSANNPKLRGRVAQALGLIARYKKDGPRKGALVGPDVEAWFRDETNPKEAGKKKRDLVGEWVEDNPSLAKEWAKSSDPVKAYVTGWARDHPEVVADWKKDNPDAAGEPGADDLAPYFFANYVKAHPGTWPSKVEVEKDGKTETVVRPATAGDDIRSIFFDTWLRENPRRIDPRQDLEQVPADLVMSSGSGLDPHISKANALYQLDDHVAEAWADKTGADRDAVRKAIKDLLDQKTEAPLGGLLGVELINVLEVNLALPGAVKGLPKKAG